MLKTTEILIMPWFFGNDTLFIRDNSRFRSFSKQHFYQRKDLHEQVRGGSYPRNILICSGTFGDVFVSTDSQLLTA